MLFENSVFHMIRLSLKQMETRWALKKQPLLRNRRCVEAGKVTSAAVIF